MEPSVITKQHYQHIGRQWETSDGGKVTIAIHEGYDADGCKVRYQTRNRTTPSGVTTEGEPEEFERLLEA